MGMTAKAYRKRWVSERRFWRRNRARLHSRIDMRMQAQWYAEARGWRVALTPPQRQKWSKRG